MLSGAAEAIEADAAIEADGFWRRSAEGTATPAKADRAAKAQPRFSGPLASAPRSRSRPNSTIFFA